MYKHNTNSVWCSFLFVCRVYLFGYQRFACFLFCLFFCSVGTCNWQLHSALSAQNPTPSLPVICGFFVLVHCRAQ